MSSAIGSSTKERVGVDALGINGERGKSESGMEWSTS
jgi:hypothetical protein